MRMKLAAGLGAFFWVASSMVSPLSGQAGSGSDEIEKPPITKRSIAQEIDVIQRRITEEAKRHQENRNSHNDRILKAKKEQAAHQRMIDRLTKENSKLEESIQKSQTELSESKKRLERLKAESQDFKAQLNRLLDEIESMIQDGIDWSISERLKDVRQVRESFLRP